MSDLIGAISFDAVSQIETCFDKVLGNKIKGKSQQKSKQLQRQPSLFMQKNFFFDKKKNRKLANIWPSLSFYGLIILVTNVPF